jgi:hypothetical protein
MPGALFGPAYEELLGHYAARAVETAWQRRFVAHFPQSPASKLRGAATRHAWAGMKVAAVSGVETVRGAKPHIPPIPRGATCRCPSTAD